LQCYFVLNRDSFSRIDDALLQVLVRDAPLSAGRVVITPQFLSAVLGQPADGAREFEGDSVRAGEIPPLGKG
jgi:hypothetical protein